MNGLFEPLDHDNARLKEILVRIVAECLAPFDGEAIDIAATSTRKFVPLLSEDLEIKLHLAGQSIIIVLFIYISARVVLNVPLEKEDA